MAGCPFLRGIPRYRILKRHLFPLHEAPGRVLHPHGSLPVQANAYAEAVDGITIYEWTITDTGIGMSRELDWEWRL